MSGWAERFDGSEHGLIVRPVVEVAGELVEDLSSVRGDHHHRAEDRRVVVPGAEVCGISEKAMAESFLAAFDNWRTEYTPDR